MSPWCTKIAITRSSFACKPDFTKRKSYFGNQARRQLKQRPKCSFLILRKIQEVSYQYVHVFRNNNHFHWGGASEVPPQEIRLTEQGVVVWNSRLTKSQENTLGKYKKFWCKIFNIILCANSTLLIKTHLKTTWHVQSTRILRKRKQTCEKLCTTKA